MSDFNLIDIVNLIRAEIRKTQVGPVKKIQGPAGEQGPQGEAGIQGPQGPRGNDGAPGPMGPKGNQGKKGDKGVKGDDGKDGVGIARVEQDIDNAIVVYTTDGNYYTIEMPLIDGDGNLAKEIHYKAGGGGGGSGIVDLSDFVRRPPKAKRTGQWLTYKEQPDGSGREWEILTTDLVETNPGVTFRDAKGRFTKIPDELLALDNQLKVNRWIYEQLTFLLGNVGDGGWLPVDQPDPPNEGDPKLILKKSSNQPGGACPPNELWIWHLDPAYVNPDSDILNEFKILWPEGKEIIDQYNKTGMRPLFKISQGDNHFYFDGLNGGWMSNTTTYHIQAAHTAGVKLTANQPCTLSWRLEQEITAPFLDANFVRKIGGDTMEGPLVMKKNPLDAGGSRDTNKVKTLGVYSGSNDALRLGVSDSSDKIYIGNNDTSFNGPIKVGEILERHDGQGTTVTNTLKINDTVIFGKEHSLLMDINPDVVREQIIRFFYGGTNDKDVTLALHGATYQNAIQIESGPSGSREIVARFDSNKGIHIKRLNAWDTKITKVATPTDNTDAVNKAYSDQQDTLLRDELQDEIDRLEGVISEIADQFAIAKYRFKSGLIYPQEAGDMVGYRANGTLTATVEFIAQLILWESDYEGTKPNWASMRPGLLRFKDNSRVISFDFAGATVDPDNGAVTLNVSNGKISDSTGTFQNNVTYLAFQPEASRTITTATLMLEHPQEVPDDVKGIVSGWTTQSDANQTFVLADYTQQQEITTIADELRVWGEDLRGYVTQTDERLEALENAGPSEGGGGGTQPKAEEGHTMMGKGSWGQNKDQLSTNQFYGIDYQDRGRGVMDQYCYGLVFATSFANKLTTNYTFLPGAWVEVFDTDGKLVFSQEIDSMEVDANNHLVVRWEYAPQIYRYQYTPTYGTAFFVKLHEVGDPTHQSRSAPPKMAPPESEELDC